MKPLTAVGIILLLSGLSVVLLTYESHSSDFRSYLTDPAMLAIALGPVVLGIISFSLTRGPSQPVHVRAIAITFLIIALSVPVTFYYTDLKVGQDCCRCGGSNLATISGSILVPSSSDVGKLTVTVLDTANGPISGILTNSSDLPGATNLAFSYDGRVVSPSNLVPVCASSTVSLQVGNVTAGSPYSIFIFLTYENFGEGYQALNMTAQPG
jgi:hypothetical protein